MSLRRLAPFLLLAAGCEQIIGADFSKPSEIRDTSSLGGGNGQQSQPAFASAQDFCSALAGAVCQQPVVDVCWKTDMAACTDATSQACLGRMTGKNGYKSTGAKGCVSETKGRFTGLTLAGDFERIRDCREAFGLFSKAGDPCETDSDCTDLPPQTFSNEAARCLVTATNTRQCVARPDNGWSNTLRKTDQPCSNSTCYEGDFCDASLATPVCKNTIKVEGEACPSADSCSDGSSLRLVCVEGTCRKFIQPNLYLGSKAAENVCKTQLECNQSFCVLRECANNEACTDQKCPDGSPCGGLACKDELDFNNYDTVACAALRTDPLLGAY